MDWALGLMSAVRLRKHLRNVVADADTLGNVCHDTVRQFSRVGSEGQGGMNCHRDVMKLVCTEQFEHILSATGDPAIDWMIVPHKMFHFLWSTFPDKFSRSLGLDPQLCFDCWSNLYSSDEGQRLWAEHPHLRGKTPADLRFTAPLTLFQDAGPFTKKKSFEMVSLAGLLGMGAELDSKIVSMVWLKDEIIDYGSSGAWTLMEESLKCLARGRGPGRTGRERTWNELDECLAEKPICGEWCFLLVFGKSDAEQGTVGWGMPSYNDGDEVCGFCLANRSSTPFTDLSAFARWRSTCSLTREQFFNRFTHPLHPIPRSEFATRSFFRPDLMHTNDNNGVINIVAASVINLVLESRNPAVPAALGSTIATRLQALNDKMASFQRDTNCPSRMPPITLQSLTLGDRGTSFSCLHGTLVKAANTRHLLPWIHDVAQAYLSGTNPLEKSAKKAVESLNEAVNLLYEADRFFTAEECDKFEKLVLRFGRHFQAAAFRSRESGGFHFQVTYKCHALQHIALYARLINPRFIQNYLEEGLIGKVAQVLRGSSRGPFKRRIVRTSLAKILIAVQLRYGGFV